MVCVCVCVCVCKGLGDLLGAWFLCVNAGRTGAVLGVWEWREEASVRRAAGMCLCSEWAP